MESMVNVFITRPVLCFYGYRIMLRFFHVYVFITCVYLTIETINGCPLTDHFALTDIPGRKILRATLNFKEEGRVSEALLFSLRFSFFLSHGWFPW